MKKSGINIAAILTLVFNAQSVTAQSVWDKETPALSSPQTITVYRSPTCGCCGKWLDHMRKHGFEIKDIKTDDVNTIKSQLGVPGKLSSCHTGLINGYIIEGHVPAGDIKKLLDEKPSITGLSVPAMPVGTPGMEMGGQKQPFAVVSFVKDGKQEKFSEYLFY